MELNHLKYFYEVARTGSFVKASSNLRVSQPAISKIVGQLEEYHNQRLLNRTRKGVTLTDIGKLFFDSCRIIFSEIDNLNNQIGYFSKSIAGYIDFAASDNLCNHLLPEIMINFRRKNPAVNFRLFSGTSSDIKAEVLADRAEFGLFYTEVKETQLFDVETLCFVEFVLIIGAKNKLSTKKTFKMEDLEKEPYIGSRITDYRKDYPALIMLKELGLDPVLSFETNNQEVQKNMVILGEGYSLVPIHMVKREAERKEIVILPTKKRVGINLHLIRKKNKALTKACKIFMEELKIQLNPVSAINEKK